MAGIVTSDPVNAARLAALLQENAQVHARFDAAFAQAMAKTASDLEAAASRRIRAVSTADKRAALDRASVWIAHYRASLSAGSAPPSARAIMRAARKSEDGRSIPRRILLAARPSEWLLQGAPID